MLMIWSWIRRDIISVSTVWWEETCNWVIILYNGRSAYHLLNLFLCDPPSFGHLDTRHLTTSGKYYHKRTRAQKPNSYSSFKSWSTDLRFFSISQIDWEEVLYSSIPSPTNSIPQDRVIGVGGSEEGKKGRGSMLKESQGYRAGIRPRGSLQTRGKGYPPSSAHLPCEWSTICCQHQGAKWNRRPFHCTEPVII